LKKDKSKLSKILNKIVLGILKMLYILRKKLVFIKELKLLMNIMSVG